MPDNCNDNMMLLGWFLARRAPLNTDFWRQDLLPASLLSASACICSIHPNFFDDMCAEDDSLKDFCSGNVVNEFGGMQYLASRERALKMRGQWYPEDYLVMGLAIPQRLVPVLEQEISLWVDGASPRLAAQNFCGQEVVRGFDVLGYSAGWHSYLCNGLENVLYDKFSTKVNPFGLISDMDKAEAFADYISERELGEPFLRWLPLAVLQHQDDVKENEALNVSCRALSDSSHTA